MVRTDGGLKSGDGCRVMQKDENKGAGDEVHARRQLHKAWGCGRGNRNEGRAARMNLLISHAAASCSEHRHCTARPSGET
jgi:hypothetical protein